MARGYLSPPGEIYCATDCEHTDCAANQKMAGCLCQHCGTTIGYSNGFYKRADQGDPYVIDHAVCVEAQIEREAVK